MERGEEDEVKSITLASEDIHDTPPLENEVENEIGSSYSRSSSPSETLEGVKSSRLTSKACGVCGDKATGNNFNALTCESCKAFFRRNALKRKEFVCPFNDSCKVDAITRRFCQKCRLRNCFRIGMKKEWIMTEDEKKAKKRVLEMSRQKRSNSDAILDPPSKTVCLTNSRVSRNNLEFRMKLHSSTYVASPESIAQDNLQPEANIDSMTAEQRSGAEQDIIASHALTPMMSHSPCSSNSSVESYMASPYLLEQIQQVPTTQPILSVPSLRIPPSTSYPQLSTYYLGDSHEEVCPPLPLNTMDSVMSVAIRAEFNSFRMNGNHQDQMSRELNPPELAKLQELLIASEALGDPVDQEVPMKLEKNSDPTLINVINLTDIAIRRLIKMSKKISAFKNMCQEDQIALLKGGCTEMMILRSVVTYDPDRDSWKIPHSFGYNIKLGVLKEARGNLYEEHQRFVKSFKTEWRSDESIMILLCVITLFTAERPDVIHKDVVKLEQDSYYYLLKRYLESILNGCEARSTYLLLIRKVAELRILNSTHLRVFLEVNPREVEPLLREVFSMA